MSLVGFDLGNENCVLAVANKHGIDVLLNDESKRETPAVVSFGEKQRFIGSAGAASAPMQPKSTISQIKRLIGRKFKDSTVQDDLRLFPFEASEGPDGGILIHLQYLNEKQTFTPIQILAMLLAHLKQLTEMNIDNCVIGIPSYFTDLQRRAYLHAAEIAGLKPLRLMHDCTAIALGYGIYKTDFPSRGPTNVIFVDVGHSDTQVAVVSFVPEGMKVLSHAFDSNLGGRDFDEILFRYFAAEFKVQYNIDVCASARKSVRLRESCEKLKKVLSANPEAPLNIEYLIEEKDVKGYIKREDFEKLSSKLLERISIPCRKALSDSGLTVEKIHTVELVGSGSRIPAITKILNSLFRKEPRRTLNASECVARGCALQCAMLSPTFRVKDFEVQDCFPFSIGLKFDEGSSCILFPKGHSFPSSKMPTLHRSDIFHMEAFYSNQEELPSGISARISSFKIGPFRLSHAEKAGIKIKFQLNLHGIVTIESASVNEMKRPKATRRQDVSVDENVFGGMTLDELSQAQEKEHQLAQQDIKMERTKDKKNRLESFVYETRNKLLNTHRSFASGSEKEGISSNLKQTEEWLYEDGDDVSEYVYTEKLEDLKKMVDPIENRYKDEEARALAAINLSNCIVKYRTSVGSLPPRERDAVIGECNKAEQWLQEKTQQQDLLPKNTDPILWSSDINGKAEALNEMCKHVISSKYSSPDPEDATESDTRVMDSGRADEGATDRRILITVNSMTFMPDNYRVLAYITSIFQRNTHPLGISWMYIPKTTQDWYWEEFVKHYRWAPEDDDIIKSCWNYSAANLYHKTMHLWQKSRVKPACVSSETWAAWEAVWSSLDSKARPVKYKENMHSEPVGPGTGMVKLTGGSQSSVAHETTIGIELGRTPTSGELFNKTHITRDNAFLDECSQAIDATMRERVEAVSQFSTDKTEPLSQDVINQLYLEIGGGLTGGQVYGLGTHVSGIHPDAMTPRPRGSFSAGTSFSHLNVAVRVAQEEVQVAREEAHTATARADAATERAHAATERADFAIAECLALKDRISAIEETMRMMINQ